MAVTKSSQATIIVLAIEMDVNPNSPSGYSARPISHRNRKCHFGLQVTGCEKTSARNIRQALAAKDETKTPPTKGTTCS